MSGLFAAHNRIAVVGYAHSDVVRRTAEPLGITALRTARAAIEDAGLTPEQIDGFTSSSLLPSSGEHEAQDGISVVTSDWLAKHLGGHAHYVAGFHTWTDLLYTSAPRPAFVDLMARVRIGRAHV